MKRTILIIAALAAIGCNRQVQTRRTDPVTVKVTRVASSSVLTSSCYVGTVESAKSSTINSPFPGTVEKLMIRKGHRISLNAPVAVVASENVRAAYDIADANLRQAQDGYDRLQKMLASGSGSVSEVQRIDIESTLTKAQAAYRAAAKSLEDCTVRTPLSGVVSDVYVIEGSALGALAPIATVIDPKALEVRFPVPEKEISSITAGADVTIDIPALEKEISGKITVRGVVASPLSHSYDCIAARFDDQAGLMSGMVCKVTLASEAAPAIAIPSRCLQSDMDGKYVWCVDENGTVEKRRVVPGDFAADRVVIKDGLKEGDRVITDGKRKVSTGMKVNIAE